MPVNLVAALLLCLAPLAIAAILGLWLTLLGWLGLPVLLEWLRVPIDAAKRIVRFATPVASWAGIAVVLVVYYPCIFGDTCVFSWVFLNLDDSTAGALLDWVASPPLVWSVLAVEGPLVLFVQFGLAPVLGLLGRAADHNTRVTGHAVNIVLLIGILTGLVGHGWPIWVAIVEPHSVWEHTKVGHFLSPLLYSFAPVNLVLMICLPGWLKVASDEHADIARGIAVAMAIAGLAGGILSALYVRRYWW